MKSQSGMGLVESVILMPLLLLALGGGFALIGFGFSHVWIDFALYELTICKWEGSAFTSCQGKWSARMAAISGWTVVSRPWVQSTPATWEAGVTWKARGFSPKTTNVSLTRKPKKGLWK